MELFDISTGIFWGASERIIYAPVLVLALGVVLWGFIAKWRRARLLAHSTHMSRLLPQFSWGKEQIKTLCTVTALVLVFIALLQPQWGRKESEVIQEGRDVLLALDISRSMAAQDLKPSRLEFVKLKIKRLLEKLTFERIGLIVFSGEAFVQVPLTADYQTFTMFLDQVSIESVSSGTTDIGAAVRKALTVFKRTQGRKNKVVILITDGEDFASQPKKLIDQVRQGKLDIYAWGAGSVEGAPVPKFDRNGKRSGYEKDKAGTVILTKLNEPLLRSLSEELGGKYEPVRIHDQDIDAIAGYLDEYDTERLESKKISRYHERYPLFLGLAWLLMILEWVL